MTQWTAFSVYDQASICSGCIATLKELVDLAEQDGLNMSGSAGQWVVKKMGSIAQRTVEIADHFLRCLENDGKRRLDLKSQMMLSASAGSDGFDQQLHHIRYASDLLNADQRHMQHSTTVTIGVNAMPSCAALLTNILVSMQSDA